LAEHGRILWYRRAVRCRENPVLGFDGRRVAGLLLGIVLVACLLLWAWRLAIHQRLASGFAVLGIAPLILLGLCFDNVLADSTTPQGLGFVLIVSWAFWQSQSTGSAELNGLAQFPR
jgi:hypothetical protein